MKQMPTVPSQFIWVPGQYGIRRSNVNNLNIDIPALIAGGI